MLTCQTIKLTNAEYDGSYTMQLLKNVSDNINLITLNAQFIGFYINQHVMWQLFVPAQPICTV